MSDARTTIELDELTVHIHTETGGINDANAVVFELSEELVVLDGQAFVAEAEALADLIDELGKPVSRFILSHDHPDHYAGFSILGERFPDVPILALPPVREYVERNGDAELAERHAAMGPIFPSKSVAPNGDLAMGEHVWGGVRFVFTHYEQAEASHQIVIELPDERVLLAVDLIYSADEHIFILDPWFDGWIAALRAIRPAAEAADHVIIGHGKPIDVDALDATIEYLTVARQALADADTAADYAGAMRAAFPDRRYDKWLERSGSYMLGDRTFTLPPEDAA